MIFWAGMRYPVWIHCCKRQNYDFCISQGSVATVLRLGGQNCGHLCYVACQKLLKSADLSRSYSQNKTGTVFFDTRCIHDKVMIKLWWLILEELCIIVLIKLTDIRARDVNCSFLSMSKWSQAVHQLNIVTNNNKKLSYRRETARQLRMSTGCGLKKWPNT